MKKELNVEVTFLKDYGPDINKTGRAHLATEQVPAQNSLAAETEEEDEDEEGVITLDLTGVPGEKAEALVVAARTSGLRVRPPFRPTSQKPFPKAKTKPRPSTPPPTRDPKVRQLRRPALYAGLQEAHGARGEAEVLQLR